MGEDDIDEHGVQYGVTMVGATMIGKTLAESLSTGSCGRRGAAGAITFHEDSAD